MLPRMVDPHAKYVRAGVMLAALTSETAFHTLEGMVKWTGFCSRCFVGFWGD